ncbi:MAG: helix-turn-helix transcriptional regulator [Bacteroidales bacterium]|nr:helix-turn-helix transcriptional regulator [Bacteroidales bacterium]
MDNYSDFVGTNVRKLRDRLGMTQEEFAEYSGVSREEISRIENGRKRIVSTSLYKIASATGIDVRQLMAGLEPDRVIVGEGIEGYKSDGGGTPSRDEALWHIEKVREFIRETDSDGHCADNL